MKIYLGADHRGYHLKERVAQWLFEWKVKFQDLGAQSLDPSDDYSKYAEAVGSMVKNNEGDKGILICGSGVGVDVVANKFDGVRASVGMTPAQVKAGRNDDDMNVLVLAADFTDDHVAMEMVKAFLETKFDHKARHTRRLSEIKKLEANN